MLLTKCICSAMLALIIALLMNFGLINLFSRTHRTKDKELLAQTKIRFATTAPTVSYQYQNRVYKPKSGKKSSG